MAADYTPTPDWLQSVLHFSTADYLSSPRPALGDTLTVSLLTPPQAPIQQVVLRTIPNGEQQFESMHATPREDGWQIWQAEMPITQRRTLYRFGIQADDGLWWLNALGASQTIPFELFDFKLLTDMPELPWLQQAVFYQIFPDRFANGDPSNDPPEESSAYRGWRRKTLAWGQPFPQEAQLYPFYGGDLQGIVQHLPYLQKLGVNALYLNPIFTAFSNHRYDVSDYKHVDPVLGGDAALIELRQALDDAGMRYLLDIVPNHCGYGHHWFSTARETAESPEAGFFYFDQYPDRYVSWMGFGSLPKLNYASQALCTEMFAGEDSVFRYWLKPPFSADGWRVDVANMLGRQNTQQLDRMVLAGIRDAVKTTNPQAYLIGENFYEASAQLQGEAWDGVMNYVGFWSPLLNWLRPYTEGALGWNGTLSAGKSWSTDLVIKTWREHLAAIPWAVATQQFNVLDSHDTPRIGTLLSGQRELVKLAAIVQFCFPGVPCVYYGDEIGILDEDGFGSRNCMRWDPVDWDDDLLSFYRCLISLRKRSLALAEGALQILAWDADWLLFQRAFAGQNVLVSAQRSQELLPERALHLPQMNLAGTHSFTGFFTGARLSFSGNVLTLPPGRQGAEIWLQDGAGS